MDQPIVDSHVHFWDLDELDYPWLDGVPPIRRPFLPEDYRAATSQLNVEKIVFVQADCASEQGLDEVKWVTSLAQEEARIQGIVAFAPLEAEEKTVRPYLQSLSQHALVRGVRRLIQSEAVDFCVQPEFVRGVQLLAEFDLSFDICIYHPQMANSVELVRRCPDVAFVLDHIGKPDIAGQLLDPWREQIGALADLPNVYCKISGLVTEADQENWTQADLKPYIDHVIDSFGIDRVMFGSDWPVATLASTYQRWVDTLAWATADLSDDERQKLFYANAQKFYRLGD